MTMLVASLLSTSRAAMSNKKKRARDEKKAAKAPATPAAPSTSGRSNKAKNLIPFLKAMVFSAPKLFKRKVGLYPKNDAAQKDPAAEDKATAPSTIAPSKAAEPDDDDDTRELAAVFTDVPKDAGVMFEGGSSFGKDDPTPGQADPVEDEEIDAEEDTTAANDACDRGAEIRSMQQQTKPCVELAGADLEHDARAIDHSPPAPISPTSVHDVDAVDARAAPAPGPWIPSSPSEAGASVPSPSPESVRKSDATIEEIEEAVIINDYVSEENRPVARVERLADGDFGMVVDLCKTASGALVVVKTALDQVGAAEALWHEFDMLEALVPSDYVVPFLGFLDFDCQKLVFAAGDGLFLDEYLDACDPELRLTEIQRDLVARDICLAVKHIHSQGVAHRDIKPDNILVQFDARTGASTAQLFEFGFATETRHSTDAAGTPGFLDPVSAGLVAGLVKRTDTFRQDTYAAVVVMDCLGQDRVEPELVPAPKVFECPLVRRLARKAITGPIELLAVHLYNQTVIPEIDREGPYGEIVAAVVSENNAESIHDILSFLRENRPHLRP